MAEPAKRAKDPVAEWVRLQQRLVVRSSNYLRRLANLASQGAIEPREYIEESFLLWSGALEEVGDWLRPRAERPPDDHHPIACQRYELRPERGDQRFAVPVEVWDRFGEDETIHLSTDGLIRVFNPGDSLKPVSTLAPEQNVRVAPPSVTRDQRNEPEIKVFGIQSLVLPGERYEGLVWGTAESDPKTRFPVAVIELTIV